MRAFETEKTDVAEVDRSVYDIKDKVNAAFEVNSGLTSEIVEKISEEKHDPEWMRIFRLKALETYNKMSIPNWGPSLEGLDMSNIVTYVRPCLLYTSPDLLGRSFDAAQNLNFQRPAGRFFVYVLLFVRRFAPVSYTHLLPVRKGGKYDRQRQPKADAQLQHTACGFRHSSSPLSTEV